MPKLPFNLPYKLTNTAKGALTSGAQRGAGYGAAGGAALGAVQGAMTSDPNNPGESTLARMGTHALGGAALGAGMGGAGGLGYGHMQNVGRQAAHSAARKGFAAGVVTGLAGGVGAGAAGVKHGPAVASAVGQAAASGAQKVKNVVQEGAQKVKGAFSTPAPDPYRPHVDMGRSGGAPAGAAPPPVINQPGKAPLALPASSQEVAAQRAARKASDRHEMMRRAEAERVKQRWREEIAQGEGKVGSTEFWTGFMQRAAQR